MGCARLDDGELDQLRRVITVGDQAHEFCMLLLSDLSRFRPALIKLRDRLLNGPLDRQNLLFLGHRHVHDSDTVLHLWDLHGLDCLGGWHLALHHNWHSAVGVAVETMGKLVSSQTRST